LAALEEGVQLGIDSLTGQAIEQRLVRQPDGVYGLEVVTNPIRPPAARPPRYTVRPRSPLRLEGPAIAFDKIHLELFFEGEVADSYLDWPLDRWHRLVDMEGLTWPRPPLRLEGHGHRLRQDPPGAVLRGRGRDSYLDWPLPLARSRRG
jgi:hypothetical protein